jgi:hypothetical protein
MHSRCLSAVVCRPGVAFPEPQWLCTLINEVAVVLPVSHSREMFPLVLLVCSLHNRGLVATGAHRTVSLGHEHVI